MPRTLLLATLATASALRVTRRALLPAAAAAVPAAAQAKPPGGTASRTEGYEVQKSEAEWQRQLSSVEYFVLRNGGTEPPNSSPLVKEKRQGAFRCAGCPHLGTPAFEEGTEGEVKLAPATMEKMRDATGGGDAVVTAQVGGAVKLGLDDMVDDF